MITLADLTPLAFCIQTEDLFDVKGFQTTFADYFLLRKQDRELEGFLVAVKRKVNSSVERKEFLEGYKLVLIRNIDKIVSLVRGRYEKISLKDVEQIENAGKELIREIILADDFDRIAQLEPKFKRNILFPVYQLFNKWSKQV